jgi:hypothetical protein
MNPDPLPQPPVQLNTPQPISNSQQAPSENKSRSMIVFIILLIILVACVASIGGFWVARQTLTTNTPSPTPTPPESPPQDPTADWKIYSNSKYSFKYPSNWTLNDLTEGKQIEVYFQPDRTKSVGAILVEKLTQPPRNISQYNIKKQIGNQNTDCLHDTSGFKTWCYLSNSMISILITKDQDSIYNEILNNILSTFKFTQTTETPTPKVSTNYIPGKDWHTVKNTTLNLTFCLPPKWDFTKNGDGSLSGELTYFRDSAYAPWIAQIQSIPYTSGSRREAYFKFWETEYPAVRERVIVNDVTVNENSVLLVSPAQNEDVKMSPEGMTVVWYTGGKLWKAGVSGWSDVNNSQTSFLKDFYTAISCSF